MRLEVRNLIKTYTIKNQDPVKALDDVSLLFPETGLVFILGKSGSGKSTLLNVMGGLDSLDSGEIIINDRSSKSFSGSEMDSYRNTYLGFIFQEYNILNDFNIRDNIALALESGLSISLRVNVNAENIGGIRELIEDIEKRGLNGYAPGPWSKTRRSSSPTSRPAPSTPIPAKRSSRH